MAEFGPLVQHCCLASANYGTNQKGLRRYINSDRDTNIYIYSTYTTSGRIVSPACLNKNDNLSP